MNAEVDAILASMNLGDGNGGGGGIEVVHDNYAHEDKKSKKKKAPIETTYEGLILRQLAPPVGEKKSWSKVSAEPMPFDSTRLYKMGLEEKKKQKKEIDAMFRSLSATQQRLVERIIQQRNFQELTSSDAIWEPWSIRKVEKERPRGFFRNELVTTGLEVIIRRKDKNKDAVNDKPIGTTTNPHLYAGKIIDLTKPMEDDPWVMIDPPGKKKKNNRDHDNVVEVPRMPPVNPDPEVFKWNGYGYEEKTPEDLQQERHRRNQRLFERDLDDARRQEHVARQLRAEKEAQRAQLQQAAAHHMAEAIKNENLLREQQGLPPLPPAAPMAPNGARNPFQPMNAHPEQFAYDNRDEYNPRFARSGSRHRRPHTPSISSSEADDFSPPRSPDLEYGFDRRQRYSRETRTPYPDERYEAYRRGGRDFDDFPGAAGRNLPRLTDFSQGYEDATYGRPRDGRRRELRQRRSYDALPYAPARRGNGW